ncbi:UDP-N-acetylmuramate--L-alanine ligase [bacterium]|nr:UDP-N-acetylmuramate--L-alanine ligase [bacterium]
MSSPSFPETLAGKRVHFIGAKGTGMAALAEIIAAKGASLSGSDVPDTFYTDAILHSLNMELSESFEAAHLNAGVDLVVYSDAYSAATNPEMAEAARRGLPMFSFAQALGALSRMSDSSGVAGVHGKTTTTAMAGTILNALGAPTTVLTGSAVSGFGGRCTLIRGDRYFVAETDEYKRHFMHFSPRRILLTSVESDHQDFYPTYDDILAAFRDYVALLPPGGLLVYCADDPGAVQVADFAKSARRDLRFAPYGFAAEGPWRIADFATEEGKTRFRVAACAESFELRVPGRHLALDAAGALALAADIVSDAGGGGKLTEQQWRLAREALAGFSGSRRRSEIVGEAGGVLVMDDYAHHPTALKATIAGIKAFWPSRRLVVDFMSHTYSRTIALMDEFAASLDAADCVVLHDIYASAREKPVPGVSGRDLFEKVKARRPDLADLSECAAPVSGRPFILYEAKHAEAAERLFPLLKEGDLFITMGAGDNWKLGRAILESLEGLSAAGRHEAR